VLLDLVNQEKKLAASSKTQFLLEILMLEVYSHLLQLVEREVTPLLLGSILDYKPDLSKRKSIMLKDLISLAKSNDDMDYKKTSPTDVLNALTQILTRIKRKKIYPVIRQHFFEDVFYMINAYLFNTLVQKAALCTSGTGFQIKFGLSPLKEWVFSTELPSPARVRDCLGHVEEAANVLVIDKKLFSNAKDVAEIFRLLNPVQILHFLSNFQTNEASEQVPRESLQAMRNLLLQRDHQHDNLKLDPNVNPMFLTSV